jgi:hypothetical protein
MTMFLGSIGDTNVMVKAALLLGVCSIIAGIAQLFLLRRINLVPALVGMISITFFANVLGHTMGLIQGFLAVGAATIEERGAMFPADTDVVMKPIILAFTLLLLATILAAIGATIRANLGISSTCKRDHADFGPSTQV